MEYLLVIGGLTLLYGGGELLVGGAVGLSRIFGLSPLVIGLTVVAFGTSAPELSSSLIAVYRGSEAIAIGNVIGSNVANIGLILGAAALVHPIAAHSHFIAREMLVLIAVTLLLPLVLLGDQVTRLQGVALTALLVPYIWMLLRGGESIETEREFDTEYGAQPATTAVVAGQVIAGGVLLVAGAMALVDGAVQFARAMGITERVIGITLVAIGTSLPEFATSVVAAMKREGDIALGNVVGSNIFNILAVLGLTAMVRPIEIDSGAMIGDLGVMLAFTLILIPFAITGRRIARVEGLILVVAYCGYVTYLFAA
jgi:cation:H+ antiporter